MKCPHCGSNDSRVIDSRPAEEGAILRRRRHCDSCGLRFSTHERVLEVPLIVVKKDGRREDFNPEKLRGGIAKACNKRSVSTDDITALLVDIESTLRAESGSEIEVERIGEIVMEKLFHLDQVAYVRFASVYQRFDDVKRFAQLLERMSRRGRRGGRPGGKIAPEGTPAPENKPPGLKPRVSSPERPAVNQILQTNDDNEAPGEQ